MNQPHILFIYVIDIYSHGIHGILTVIIRLGEHSVTIIIASELSVLPLFIHLAVAMRTRNQTHVKLSNSVIFSVNKLIVRLMFDCCAIAMGELSPSYLFKAFDNEILLCQI